MITTLLAATLIAMSPAGTPQATENLTDAACEAARCVALYGSTCEEQAAHQARNDAVEVAWNKRHPDGVATICGVHVLVGGEMATYGDCPPSVQPGFMPNPSTRAATRAWCVK